LAPYVRREQRAKAVPPVPHRLKVDVDAAFEQQVVDVPRESRKLTCIITSNRTASGEELK
jgi:hypothetical protein